MDVSEVKNPTIGSALEVRIGETTWRHAVVVADWGHGCVNAQVFLDGSNDIEALVELLHKHWARYQTAEDARREARHICSRGMLWVTSINQGEALTCWRWPSV